VSPLEELLEAVREHERGNKEKSASLLSQALGSPETLKPVRDSIDTLVKPSPPLAGALLHLLASEERRRNGRNRS